MYALVQYDDRNLSQNFLSLQKRNKQYCAKHNYKYIFSKLDYNIPQYWVKVKLVLDTLKENPNLKGVFWLDTDAVIHNINTGLDNFLKEGKSFYCSSDCPRWHSPFNAGVWLVQNTEDGLALMEEWMSLYHSNDWVREDWKTNGDFAGSTYEQGAFCNSLLDKHKDKIYMVPWIVFQSFEPSRDTFTIHFAGQYKEETLPNYVFWYLSYWLILIIILVFIIFIIFIVYKYQNKV